MILAGALTWEVIEYLKNKKTVLVPVGSLEQHGDAAPLACDTIIPVRLCAAAGMKTYTAVTPAVTFGMSENHMGFPGTVTLQSSTLSGIARDISVSLYTHGFRKIVFLSGHGGNRSPIIDGLNKASEECPEADLRYLLYRDLPGAVEKQKRLFCPDPGYHVTVTEVSMVWHLMGREMPEFERVKFPPEPPVGAVISREKWKELYPDGGAGSDLKFVSEEKGEVFFDFLVNSLCLYLEALEKGR
ncbi:MAG: creatininase family protein [Candidatus Aegiribacteria sp.]|nr:creatininase family protein [Candidatus Aegiribacteria sp.]